MALFDFQGKTALVTGGTSGLGKATATALVRAGARVIVTGRDEAKGRQVVAEWNLDREVAEFIRADLAQPADLRRLFTQIRERYGRIDCVVNNAAGDAGVGKPLHGFDEAELERTLAVNFRGVWWCMKLAIEQMLAQEPAGGALVNVASVNALGGVAGGSLYAASKAAVIALTKSAALEVGRHGIKVNVFVPGPFETPLLERALVLQSDGSPEAVAALRQRYEAGIPQGRIGFPEEAAEAILWLCSTQTPYLSGHSLVMDGGLSAAFR